MRSNVPKVLLPGPIIWILAFLLFSLSGCFLTPKKKGGKGGGSNKQAGILDRSSVFIDRLGTGDKIRLKFKTARPALCLVRFYSQEEGIEPTKAAPKEQSCSNEAPAQEFTELFEEIRDDTLYFFELRLWGADAAQESAEVVLIKESTANTPPGGQGGGNETTSYSDLFIARFDVPRKFVQTHRHELNEVATLTDIRGSLARVPGCQAGFPEESGPFRTFSEDSKIRRISTREFATDRATRHPNYKGVDILEYNHLNEGLDYWQWTYEYNGEDSSLLSRTGNRFLNVEIAAPETYSFSDPQLEEVTASVAIDATKPLTLSWTTDKNLLELAYVIFFIGRANVEKSIYCVFEAKSGTGTVSAELLRQLPAGKHYVLAQLETTQIKPREGWIIAAYDWRSGRIEKN